MQKLSWMRRSPLWALTLILALVAAACAPAPAAAPAAAEPAATAAPAEEVAPAPAEGVFTYWGGLIFSDAANQMLVDRVTAWGQEKGVQTEVVMINQNETTQRVSAAVEAGTMPSALDMGGALMLLLSQTGELEPLDALYDEIGASVTWLPVVDESTNPDRYGGHRYGIPFGPAGNVMYRRADLLEPAGFTEAPQTWEEMADMARAINDPPNLYGMGIALSNVGDGNLTTAILQSWGGRIADDAGTTCTIDSPETRAFLEWITTAYNDGLFPPGATTWDGAGDNVAYQSGQAGFIANPGSVYLWMLENDPELAEGTKYSAYPSGPAMRVASVGINVRVIPSTSPHKDLAMDLFKNLAQEDFMEEYYANAIYGPAAEAYADAPIFTDSAVHAGQKDLILNGTYGAFPDIDNEAFSEYQTNFLTPRMIQRIVVDGISIDESVAETQAACQAIYDKYQ